jgi:hypothetical protein
MSECKRYLVRERDLLPDGECSNPHFVRVVLATDHDAEVERLNGVISMLSEKLAIHVLAGKKEVKRLKAELTEANSRITTSNDYDDLVR